MGRGRVRAGRRRDRDLRQPPLRGSARDHRGDHRRRRRALSRSSRTGAARSSSRSTRRSRATSSWSRARGTSRVRSSRTASCRSTTARSRASCSEARRCRRDPADGRRGRAARRRTPRGDRRPVTGVKIDSRLVEPGDLFVAIGPGKDFLADARSRGAAATLVPKDAFAAVGALGAAIRERSSARVVGITGSTGKTSTKDILHALCSPVARTVAAEASFNNELGVPLTSAGSSLTPRSACSSSRCAGSARSPRSRRSHSRRSA